MDKYGGPLLLMFTGGLAFFLYGIFLLQRGLKKNSGTRLRSVINNLTSHRLLGLISGGAITALLQSSSAATVMFVSLASSGVLTLAQAVPLILGADIGTTITVQIISFKLSNYSLVLVMAGVLIRLFAKTQRIQGLGQIILGFGLVFYGMHVMGEAVSPLKGSPHAATVAGFLRQYPLYGLVIGAVFTAIVQSSAATIGMAISLGQSGIIDLTGALPIILGANIGTCVTALLASLAANTEGKRVALLHVFFKIGGSVLGMLLLKPFVDFVALTTPALSHQMANAHTIFNVTLALAVLPLSHLVARLGGKMLAHADLGKVPPSAMFLDERSLATPALAFANVQREIMRMAELIQQMISKVYIFYTNPDQGEPVKALDDKVDVLYEDIKFFLAKLSRDGFEDDEAKQHLFLFDTVTHLEEAGDILSKNMVGLLRKKHAEQVFFSDEGLNEIKDFHQQVFENFKQAMAAHIAGDRELAAGVVRKKAVFRELEKKLRIAHVSRLGDGVHDSLATSDLHLEILGNLRRFNSVVTRIVRPLAISLDEDEES